MSKNRQLNWTDPKIEKEIMERQRRGLWSPDQIQSLAKRFRLQPGSKLLDAGCGYGYSLRNFGPFCMPGGDLVGVDLEEKLLKTARRLTVKEGLGDAARFEVGDIYDLGFDDNTFDVVMAQVVLCHLSEPEKALDEIIRVTRRGGCVAIFDNATWGGRELYFDPNHDLKLEEMLFTHEMAFRRARGRKELGEGDFSVGCRVPAWMEARGMREVDAICNERVLWVAPPYRSSAQKGTLRNWKEWNKQFKPGEDFDAHKDDHWDAGGADTSMKRKFRRLVKRREDRSRQELAAGTASFAESPQFWCIWGFKG